VRLPRRVLVLAVLLGGLVLLGALVVTTASGPVDYVSGSAGSGTFRQATRPDTPQTAVLPSFLHDAPDLPLELPGWMSRLLQVLLCAAGLLAAYLLFWLARYAIGLIPRRTRRPDPPKTVPSAVLPEVPEALTGAGADRRRALLTGGEPRNAVVACWVDLEESAAESGLEREPWETPGEYVARVLATWSVDAAALADLAELYREARFSAHPVDEAARGRALTDLDRVHAGLALAAAEPAAASGATP
jgi:hypothetical protein